MLKMNMFIKIFTFMQNICKKTVIFIFVKEKAFILFFFCELFQRERKKEKNGLFNTLVPKFL